MHGLIQIAGVNDLNEAKMLREAGVHHIGFPLKLSVHAEDLTEHQAAAIIARLDLQSTAILITYLEHAEAIQDLCARLGVNKVQLHSNIAAMEIARLRKIHPELFIIKSLIVREANLPALLSQVETYSAFVDGFITDTYDPSTGASGATGKVHKWKISRNIVEASRLPVILAGGLNPANVRKAILQVRPSGVDVHTGVEGPEGRKDEVLVKQFVAEAKAAFARCVHSSTVGAVF
jgi:phosphoribosylanthranilate isomerase